MTLWPRERSDRRDLAVLLALAAVLAAANIWWAVLEQRPPHWDMARHLVTSLDYAEAARTGHWGTLLRGYFYYPPLLYLMVLPWYWLGSSSIVMAVAANIFWLGLLILSVYGLGRLIWDRRTGLVVAVVAVGTPMLVTQLKEFQTDAPLAAVTAAACYALLKTKRFYRLGWSVGAGIVLGAGLLLKWTFGLVMLVPLVMMTVAAGVEAWRRQSLRPLQGLSLAAGTAYCLAAAWYWSNIGALRAELLANSGAAAVREGDPTVWSAASNLWYFQAAINQQLYLVLVVVLLLGVGAWLVGRRRWQFGPWFLAATVLGNWLIFTALPNKDARYTLPVIPLLVVLGIGGLLAARRPWVGKLAVALVVYSAVTWLLISFVGSSRLPSFTLSNGWTVWAPHGYIISAPTDERWHQSEAFERAAQLGQRVYYQAWDSIWFNNWGAVYYAQQKNLQLITAPDQLGTAQAVITRTVPPTAAAQFQDTYKPEPATGLELIWSADLPDGSRVAVWRPAK